MDETSDPLHRVITRCWEDDAFEERLLADPARVLRRNPDRPRTSAAVPTIRGSQRTVTGP